MKEEDLDKTKPIATLNELSMIERLDEVANETSRSEKYENALEKEKIKVLEEEAEEALAEKNIAMAEALIAQEKIEKENALSEEKTSEVKGEKLHLITVIKRKWNNMDKRLKIFLIVLFALLIVGLIAYLMYRLLMPPKEETPAPPLNNTVEEAPVIADNYYYKEGKLFFKDSDRELGSYECTNKDSKLCYVGLNNYRDTFDIPRLVDEHNKDKEQRIPIYEDNYVFIFDSAKESDANIKLYSIKEESVIDEYAEVKSYDNNYVVVKNNSNNYGLIEINNGLKEIIKPQYRYLGMINGENNLLARNDKGYVIINNKNKAVSSTFNSNYEIKYYNDKYVVALVSNDYNVYNYKADLLESGYDFVTVNKDYMALVNDDKIYVKDINKVKYNELGINLKNDDYVKTYIYDENDKLIETKRSFELNVSSNKLEVAIYDNSNSDAKYTNLDIVVAQANEKYDYINYFENRLFFYKDADKTDLIGYYTCSNQNIVSKKEDEYVTCIVANDTIYEDNDMVSVEDLSRESRIPLFNDRFVFIADGTNNIVLFDLKEQKSLSSYTNVNTYTKNNDNKFTQVNGTFDIIALNKKGKYGMITINGTSVSTKYKFDYNRMEKLGKYTLALNSANKWVIIYGTNSESVEFSGKVMGYNEDKNISYFKVISGNKYVVYDYKGNLVTNDNYDYVELYSDYYAGVNNKEVNIYNYDGDKISTEGVKIGEYQYSKTGNPAFKVRKSGSNYIVSVYNGSNYEDNIVNTSPKEEEVLNPEPDLNDDEDEEE